MQLERGPLPLLVIWLGTMLGAAVALGADSEQPWENLNPGCGGQIQNINLDPHTPGRAYLSSDMEGIYRSDDHGESWMYLGRGLTASHATFVSVSPADPRRVYCGTEVGLDISDDAGETWRPAEGIEFGTPIREIAFADAGETIYAAPGMRVDWESRSTLTAPEGDVFMYVSRDGGRSFQRSAVAAQGSRQMYSITARPGREDQVFLAGSAGLFVSEDAAGSWRSITAPPGFSACRGADLSPDGRAIYAVFGGRDEQEELFAAQLKEDGEPANWIPLKRDDAHGFPSDLRNPRGFWRPRLSPRSDGSNHRLLLGTTRSRTGLFQLSTRWEAGEITDYQWKHVFYYDLDRGPRPVYDSGWERYLPRSLYYAYTPATWPDEEIWTTGDQTLFRGQTGAEPVPWKPIYTQQVAPGFCRTRGAQSTVVFDGEQLGQFVMQCNADNAVLESFDGGHSWRIGIQQPRSNAAAILRDTPTPIALAHTSSGWGGASRNGTLHAKLLSGADQPWRFIAGGETNKNGLPDVMYHQLVPDPGRKGSILVATHVDGIYVLDDVPALIDGAGSPARKISGGELGGPRGAADKSTGMAFSPGNPDLLWVADGMALWKGVRQSGRWSWHEIRKGISQFHVWKNNDTEFVACIDEQANTIELSWDAGQTWQPVGSANQLISQQPPSWYSPERNTQVKLMGLTAHADRLYVAVVDFRTRKAFGYYTGQITPAGVTWSDFTANFGFAFPVKARIISDSGKTYLYVGTWGFGWWRREL